MFKLPRRAILVRILLFGHLLGSQLSLARDFGEADRAIVAIVGVTLFFRARRNVYGERLPLFGDLQNLSKVLADYRVGLLSLFSFCDTF